MINFIKALLLAALIMAGFLMIPVLVAFFSMLVPMFIFILLVVLIYIVQKEYHNDVDRDD